MQTETLDKLYLEWSQFTKARNKRELLLLEALSEIHKLWACPTPKTLKDWSARCDVMADYARAAIKAAE